MLLIQAALDKEDLAEVTTRLKGLTRSERTGTRKLGDPYQNDSKTRAVMGWIRTQIARHPLVSAYAQPLRWSQPLLARHTTEDAYGLQIPDAVMKAEDGAVMRNDLAYTLFLNAKSAYDGGAVSLEANDGTRDVRLEAGDMVIHRTGQLHQIAPVTRGERIVCVGWIQSLTPRADERDILFDLNRMAMNSRERDQQLMLQKTINDLVRMWGKV